MHTLRVFTALIISLAFYTFAIHTASAAPYTSIQENIQNFTADIKINFDGTIDVAEKITYDFGPNERHGIYREIPLIKTNAEGKKFRLKIYDVKVSGDKFTKEVVSSQLRIKIGDPYKTITGVKRYVIEYTVAGALTYFSDHDELYWNITGDSWKVPIQQFTGLITLPVNLDYQSYKFTCYTGPYGSTEQNCTISYFTDQKSASGTKIYAQGFPPNSGITAVIGFPKDVIAVLEPSPDRSDFWFKIFFFGFIGLWTLFSTAVPVFIVLRWLSDRKQTRLKAQIVSAWFEPPQHENGVSFTPAETALILNKKLDHKSVTATLIQLAQKGYLKINAEDKKEIVFIRKKEWDLDDKLTDYEKTILDGVFSNGLATSVSDKELKNKLSFHNKIVKSEKDLSKSLFDEKFFKENPLNHIRTMNALLYVSSVFGTITFPILIWAWLVKNKSARRTDFGIEKYSKAQSLKNFLVSQTEQLNFQTHNQMFFEKLLPYATALGVEKIWAKRFADLDFVKTDWYEGDLLGAAILADTTSQINSQVKHSYAMSSTSSSSGFGSGFSGGSSGGGGGGGGGGSW